MSYSTKVLIIVLFVVFCGAVNGVVIGFLVNSIATGVMASIVTMLATLVAVLFLGMILWVGTINDLSGLDKKGNVVYEVVPLIDRGPGCEFMHIAESGRRYTKVYYAINTNLIRGGVEAIPRDGTPFKLIRGSDYDDIVVVKIPQKEKNQQAVEGYKGHYDLAK